MGEGHAAWAGCGSRRVPACALLAMGALQPHSTPPLAADGYVRTEGVGALMLALIDAADPLATGHGLSQLLCAAAGESTGDVHGPGQATAVAGGAFPRADEGHTHTTLTSTPCRCSSLLPGVAGVSPAASEAAWHALAVLAGTAVNQDGRSSSLTAPNGPSQQEVVLGALRAGELAAAQLSHLQMHGTGTPLGDPIEVGAAAALLLRAGQPRGAPLRLTAAKSMMGHAEPAAGIGAPALPLVLLPQRVGRTSSLSAAPSLGNVAPCATPHLPNPSAQSAH